MLTATIDAVTYKEAVEEISSALKYADAIELRLDYWTNVDFNLIKKIRQEFSIPMIFTVRKISDGGKYSGNENDRLKLLSELCDLSPEYIDIEHNVSKDFLKELQTKKTSTQFICSYHNFNETPENLLAILLSMLNPLFSHYKIATMAKSGLDALRMLQFVQDQQQEYSLTGLCMSEEGHCTRIAGGIVGSKINYAILDSNKVIAPGQLSLEVAANLYRTKKLNKHTKIYALLGDPVNKSVGHILHNEAMKLLNKNTVYTKLKINKEELADAVRLCRALPFAGFSITMPLKEAIVPLMDSIDQAAHQIGAINTITVNQEEWLGSNTDGKGAIHAILERTNLQDKRVVILGAGGAARAITYEALQEGANVTIINRTFENAKRLADDFGCDVSEYLNFPYDVIINTLPEEVYGEITFATEGLLKGSIAMDIVYQPIHTVFLKMAKQAGCICIPGYEMYVRQAVRQLQTWFDLREDQLQSITSHMNKFFEKNF